MPFGDGRGDQALKMTGIFGLALLHRTKLFAQHFSDGCTHRRRGIGFLHECYLREAAKAAAAIRTMLGCKVPNLGFCPCGAWGGTEK